MPGAKRALKLTRQGPFEMWQAIPLICSAAVSPNSTSKRGKSLMTMFLIVGLPIHQNPPRSQIDIIHIDRDKRDHPLQQLTFSLVVNQQHGLRTG